MFVCKNKKLKTDNVYLEDIEFDKNGEYNTEEEVATCFDRQIVNVFDKRLFDALPDQFVFHSNVSSHYQFRFNIESNNIHVI